MTRRRVLIAGWLLVLALSAALPLSAIFRGVVHVGVGTFYVEQRLDRPIVSIGSNVVLRHGTDSTVVVLVGNAHLLGRIGGDVVAADGNVFLAPSARVDGDMLSVLGGVFRAPGASVTGRIGGPLHRWNGKALPKTVTVRSTMVNSVRLGLAAGLALLLVGTCLTIVFPWQVVLIATTLRGSPLKSGAAGLMCLLVFAFLVVPLSLSLAGLPFAVLLTGAASLSWLFGFTACAVVLGRAVARGPVSLLWATAAGLVVLALSMAVPFVGPLMATVVGVTGAGALAVALLSRARPASPLS